MNKESINKTTEKPSSQELDKGFYKNSRSKMANYAIVSASGILITTGLFFAGNYVLKNNDKNNTTDTQEPTTIEINESVQNTNLDSVKSVQNSGNTTPESAPTAGETIKTQAKVDEETLKFEETEGRKMTQGIKELEKNYPLINSLPIYARLYTVNVCKSEKVSDKPVIAVCIDSNQKREDIEPYVKKHISSLGFNLDDYEVRWTESP